MNKATTRTTIIIALLVMALVGYYAYLSNKGKEEKADATMTMVQSTLSRDLSKDYPPTPKQVIKYYNDVMKCLYNEPSTDEEIEALGDKARELYDEELLSINAREDSMPKLMAEVKTFRSAGRRITSMNLASSTSVYFFEEDGFEFARIMCGYNVSEGSFNHPSSQVYLLRKDADKRWKIYGWEDADKLNLQAESN